jgi:hypothetical protein
LSKVLLIFIALYSKIIFIKGIDGWPIAKMVIKLDEGNKAANKTETKKKQGSAGCNHFKANGGKWFNKLSKSGFFIEEYIILRN